MLLGLLLGLALHPGPAAAVSPSQAALEQRVSNLEQFAGAAEMRLDDLDADVEQLVIDLIDLTLRVDALDGGTGGGGGGGGGCVDGRPCETADGLPGETYHCECVPFAPQ